MHKSPTAKAFGPHPCDGPSLCECPLFHHSVAQAGHAIRRLLELDLKPRDIMTREAFENALVPTQPTRAEGIGMGGRD
jgi:hypothetical protein